MIYAPIALFVYNRPKHTRLTVEALQKNTLASESDLIVFSDAAKSEVQAEAVSNVRRYIHQIDGFKSVTIIEREANFGLAKSIIEGVTSVVNERNRIIVLEDDLITSPYFLDYMNTSLDVYQEEDKVMHISGYMFPIKNPEKLPETFFYRASTCWGWATWKRAWDSFQLDSFFLLENIHSHKLEYEFDIHGTMDFISMLKAQSAGVVNSWAIRWYANIFLKSGLCLHPAISLVNNIGHDGSGVHCDSSTAYTVDALNSKPIKVEKLREINESSDGLAAIEKFNRSLRPPFYLRVYSGLARRLRKIVGFTR
jgi:hypothetical protein